MKPVFRLEDYEDDDVVMVCRSVEEATVFSKFLDSHGRRWCSGDRYIDSEIECNTPESVMSRFKSGVCYFFNEGLRGSIYDTRMSDGDYRELMFSDFDWSKESVDINIDVDACMSII